MSFMKDIKRTFLKYSEKVVNKTDNLTQIAKLNIEIKKAIAEIDDRKTKIGDAVLIKHESNADSIMFKDSEIAGDLEEIDNLKIRINELKISLEEVKKKKETSEVINDKDESGEEKV